MIFYNKVICQTDLLGGYILHIWMTYELLWTFHSWLWKEEGEQLDVFFIWDTSSFDRGVTVENDYKSKARAYCKHMH